MRFTIVGAPRTKKTSQRIVRNKRTGSTFIVSSKLSKSWEGLAVGQLAEQYVGYSSLCQPVNCRAAFYREADRGDLVNYMQALADALQAAGVIENDRLIVAWDGSRLLLDRKNPRVELELTPMG